MKLEKLSEFGELLIEMFSANFSSIFDSEKSRICNAERTQKMLVNMMLPIESKQCR